MLEPGELAADGIAVIGGERLAHLQQVQRFTAGDRLRAGIVGGLLGTAEILQIDAVRATLRVKPDTPPPAALPCTLILALPRPKMLKRILVDATSIGVKRICFINSYRVDKSFWSSPLLAPAAIAAKCRLGLEQAIDTVLPDVTLHPRFRPFVEDELPGIVGGTTALVAHPGGTQASPAGVAHGVALAIGPEGGFIPFEIELLQNAAGFTPVTLGPRILRVDTAVPHLLGRLFTGRHED